MAIIQLHCAKKQVVINPRVVNTDVVEWFFGDTCSMVGGATNKLRVKVANAADKKASAFNKGWHGVVSNNKSAGWTCSSASKKGSMHKYRMWIIIY